MSPATCVLLYIFFVYSYADPPDLHSFPTRRSSDLEVFDVVERALVAPDADAESVVRAGLRYLRAHPRSEEHTSELQSLRHLVCRLLLEKKKKTGQTCPKDPGI